MKTAIETICIMAFVLGLLSTADRFIFLYHDTRDVNESVVKAVMRKVPSSITEPCEIVMKSDKVIARCGGHFWPLYKEYQETLSTSESE